MGDVFGLPERREAEADAHGEQNIDEFPAAKFAEAEGLVNFGEEGIQDEEKLMKENQKEDGSKGEEQEEKGEEMEREEGENENNFEIEGDIMEDGVDDNGEKNKDGKHTEEKEKEEDEQDQMKEVKEKKKKKRKGI